jgi:hypothetical protein
MTGRGRVEQVVGGREDEGHDGSQRSLRSAGCSHRAAPGERDVLEDLADQRVSSSRHLGGDHCRDARPLQQSRTPWTVSSILISDTTMTGRPADHRHHDRGQLAGLVGLGAVLKLLEDDALGRRLVLALCGYGSHATVTSVVGSGSTLGKAENPRTPQRCATV